MTKSVDADGNVTSYAYDGVGNQTKVIDPDGNVTSFVFNADNLVINKIDPNGTTTYVYDADLRLTKTIDQLGQTVSVTYDADSRETGEKWYNSSSTLTNTLTYTYDNASNMLTAADGNGKYTFTYDADNRIQTQQDMFGTTTTYSYDAAGNMTGIVDSLGGTQTMVYDAANRETTVEFSGNSQALNEGIAYNADSQPSSVSRYSNVAGTTLVGTTSYTYDNAGQVTDIHHLNSSAGNITNVTYTYDAANNLSTQDRDSTTTTYSYDATGQITGNGSTTYAYDADGNRNNAGFSVGTNNQISTDGTWTYTYDNAGEITEKSEGASSTTWYFTYDNRHMMVSATEYTAPAGTLVETVNYKYDVFGDLITEAVTVGMTTTTTNTAFRIVDPAVGIVQTVNLAWADVNTSDALVIRYLFDNLSPAAIAYINSGGVVWLLKDNIGSSIVAVSNGATVLAQATYDPFGNITVLSGTGADLGVILFAGYRFDAQTGLYLAEHRWYNPATGQWTTMDPLGFAAGDENTRRYVDNLVVKRYDPAGLAPPVSYRESQFLNSGQPPLILQPTDDELGNSSLATDTELLRSSGLISLFEWLKTDHMVIPKMTGQIDSQISSERRGNAALPFAPPKAALVRIQDTRTSMLSDAAKIETVLKSVPDLQILYVYDRSQKQLYGIDIPQSLPQKIQELVRNYAFQSDLEGFLNATPLAYNHHPTEYAPPVNETPFQELLNSFGALLAAKVSYASSTIAVNAMKELNILPSGTTIKLNVGLTQTSSLLGAGPNYQMFPATAHMDIKKALGSTSWVQAQLAMEALPHHRPQFSFHFGLLVEW